MPRLPLILLLAALIVGAAAAGLYLGSRPGHPPAARGDARRPETPAVKTLTVWAPGDAEVSDGIHDILAAAEESLGLTIELRLFPTQEAYREAREKAAVDGTLPDLFWLGSVDVEHFDRMGVLRHIPLKTFAREKWVPQTLPPFIRGDAILAYPSQYSVLVLFYNKADFDKLGVAYPGPHWNWDALISLCRLLYRPATEGDDPHYALEFSATIDLWNAFAAQVGGPVYRLNQWLLGAPKEAAAQREALRFLTELREEYLFCAPPTAPDQPTHFESGRSALLIGRSELRDVLKDTPNLSWGVTVLPYRYATDADRQTRATPLRIAGWAVSAHSGAPAAASELAERLSTYAFDGWLSARRDVANESEEPPLPDIVDQGLPFFAHPQSWEINEKINQQLAALRTAEVDVDGFLAKLERTLAPYHLRPAVPAPSPAPPKPAANVR